MKNLKDMKNIFQCKILFYISKIILFKLINYYNNNLLTSNLKINKT